MKNFTIVSDPGIDDLVALVLLYKLQPENKNVLVSTFGNATEEITSKNAKEFISFVANHWSFKHGAAVPISGTIEWPWPDYFHGQDGTWNIHPPTDIGHIQSLSSHPIDNDVISLATLTTPLQLLKETEGKNFTIMGGAFTIEGNETKYAETNIAFDPDAAQTFFNGLRGQHVQVIPLDVTRKVVWSKEQVDAIPQTNHINIWIKKLLLAWFDNYNHEKEKDFNLHDPLAVYLHFFPDNAIWENSGIEVITKGEKRGQTVFNKKNTSCAIALDAKNPPKISENIYNVLFD